MGITLMLIFSVLLALLFDYHWRRRRLYKLSYSLPGPTTLPLIGNGFKFMCKQDDILQVINSLTMPYSKPLRIWFGPRLIIVFSYPEHLEKILTSSKLAIKHDLYDLVKLYLGNGLITNSGPIYKKHRRMIQPLINIKYTSSNMECFQKHIDIFLGILQKHCDQEVFDVFDYVHKCFADIIGETILGIQMNSQIGQNSDYLHASLEMYTVGYARLMRPWLHPNVIYSLTKEKAEQDRIISLIYNFIKQAVLRANERVRSNDSHVREDSPLIDQIAEFIKKEPTSINERDFIYHMFTLYAASEDTMTLITSVLCVCFGMYPEYQENAVAELKTVIKDLNTPITYDDLPKLSYLSMCVKDVLRLIPIAPIIARKCSEDFHIDNITLPKGCGILVSIFDLHRNPDYWENPNHFHPDHFLPEVVAKRHIFAYVPFSAGPRGCIGKLLAYAGLKLTMANILRSFVIEADGKFPDLVLRTDISVRSLSGYKIRIKTRKYT